MEAETAKAIQYAQQLLDVAIDVVRNARVELDESWARNPKVVALNLLCRSLSNFRAAVLLVQQSHVMEARVLVRCLYENLLWMGALRERGSAFVQDMIQDEAFNRKALGELTLKMSSKHGVDVSGLESLRLVSTQRLEDRAELTVNVEARTTPAELRSTVLHACRALMGTAVGANELVGFTNVSDKLGALVTEFEKNGWARGD